MLVSLRGSNVDLMHVLFGTVLALNNDALMHDRRGGDDLASCRWR